MLKSQEKKNLKNLNVNTTVIGFKENTLQCLLPVKQAQHNITIDRLRDYIPLSVRNKSIFKS